MSICLNSSLIQRLSDAVVTLNVAGDILDYNQPAKQYLQLCFELLPLVKQKIRQDPEGDFSQPALIKRMLYAQPGGCSLEIWLCKSIAGFSLLVLNEKAATLPADANDIRRADISVASLVGADIRSEIAAICETMAELQCNSKFNQPRLLNRLERLSQLLLIFELIVETSSAPAFINDDRIVVQPLLHEILMELRGAHGDYVINHAQSDEADKQGILYGKQKWLKVALKSLVEALYASAPMHCQIEIRIRQNGSFIVITGGYRNLNEWIKSRAKVALREEEPVSTHAAKELRVGAGIRLTVAKQIVELHGGQLRVQMVNDNEAGDEIDGFTLLMPTGVPSQGRSPAICRHCIYPQQAKSLAEDLAQLLSRQPAPTHVSAEEQRMLADLSANSGHF